MTPTKQASCCRGAAALAAALCLASLAAAGATLEQRFGSVSVTLQTTNLPRDFAVGNPSSPGYSNYSSVVISFAVRVGDKPIYVPLDAFAGLGDPKSIDVEELLRDKRWRLKLTGGDAGTAYCAVMEFDTAQIRSVNLLSRCQGKVPFATKRYARVEVLN